MSTGQATTARLSFEEGRMGVDQILACRPAGPDHHTALEEHD